MTTASSSLEFNNTSNAQFRAWGSWVGSTLTTFGFPKTADTGQINWTTVSAPGAGSTIQGYEVRTFNDSAESTSPIYMKLEFGSGTNAATPFMYLTVGTGSDGAGTITGTAITSRQGVASPSSAAGGGQGNCYAWTDGSAFGFLMWPGMETTNSGFFFGIERWRANDGTATTHGATEFHSYTNSSSATAACRLLPYVSGFANSSSTNSWLAVTPATAVNASSNQTASQGLAFYPAPVFSGWLNRLYGPSQMLLACGGADLAAGSQIAISHYGTSRTFLAAGPGNPNNYWGTGINIGGSSNYRSFLLRWD